MNAVDTINTRQAAQVDDTADGGESSSMLVMGYRYLQKVRLVNISELRKRAKKKYSRTTFSN